jgi:hypothetical protein
MRYATVGMVCARPMVVVASSSAIDRGPQFPPIVRLTAHFPVMVKGSLSAFPQKMHV